MEICIFDEKNEEAVPVHEGTENLLARFFNIDLKKVEEEKRNILFTIQLDAKTREPR